MKKTITAFGCLLTTALFAQNISITELGRYTNGQVAASEITAYDAASKKLFITNSAGDSIDIIDVTNPSLPTYSNGIDITAYGGAVNSVVNLNNGFFAAAIESVVKQDSGSVVFFNTNGVFAKQVKVGALPDMLALTHDGTKVLVANEGEPNNTYTIDPEGSVSIIDVSGGVANLTQNDVTFINFNNAPTTIPGSLKKPGATWAEDLEPEYIALSENDSLAFVSCQESNVIVTIDLTTNTILSYKGLGFKDHSIFGNGLDASDKDFRINIANYPIKGVYQPDAIAAYAVNNNTYVITANEGDSRDYAGYSSETKISNLTLDSTVFPNAATLQADSVLGRLKTFTIDMIGDIDNDSINDEIYVYGARSFSIWDATGNLVWDSGDEIETYCAANHPTFFNCNDGKSSKQDTRSDDKGPEPEGVTIGEIGNKFYAFIGLERQGGIMVYDVTNPNTPSFTTYIHTIGSGTVLTDISPEGLLFIPKSKSHTNENLLIVSNEGSGTTTIYQINDLLVGIEQNELNNEFTIYPNPFKDIVKITTKNTLQNAQIKLFNSIGQLVYEQQNINEQTVVIERKNLTSGIYYLQLIEGDNTNTQKLIIE